MSHDHGHRHGTAARNLGIAFALNLVFTLLEVGGGLWTNSIAILSDALHDGGDCLSLGIAWYLHRLSQRDPDVRFTYGYRRFSSLGALITGGVLLVGLSFVGWSALRRLGNPEEVKVPGMMAMAVLGIVMNGAAAWVLSGGKSLNEQIAIWHLLEDTLGWAAVLIGSAVMLVWHLPIIDPLLALGISVFIIWNVFRNLSKVVFVFLQSTPHGFDTEEFQRQLATIPGIVSAHHTHLWTLDGERHVFSTHLVMHSQSTRAEIVAVKRQVHELLHTQDFEHITVEVELEGEMCAADNHHHDDHDHPAQE
jgi:cobalt-zinc-cadmium efflux system protein